jgi:hypothetical protein
MIRSSTEEASRECATAIQAAAEQRLGPRRREAAPPGPIGGRREAPRPPRRTERALGPSLALVAALVVTPAWGQTNPSADPKEMARTLGEEGLALHGAGRFADAYEKFATAERIQHSPVLVLWMARSKRALAELLEARRLYDRVATETLASDASPKWQNAQRDATTELAALRPRIPTLAVRFAEGVPADAAVTIDGKAVAAGDPQELDPGDHRVEVNAAGYAAFSRDVHLGEGDHEVVEVPSFGSTEPEEGSVVPGAVLVGIGGAGLLAGVATGVAALVLADQVESSCVDGRFCLPEDEAKADDADALGRASTGLFIAGGVIAAVGIVLVVVRPGGGEEVGLGVGPGSFGVRATF